MYNYFFGFNEKPFNMTPDPKYYFASEKHRSALDSLVYAVNERKGFVVVTGEIGSGKTTICRTLLENLEDNTTVAMITNTHLTPKQMIETALEEYEVMYTPGPKNRLLSQLNRYLIGQLSHDRNVVLIIDEAQNLSPKCLEEVRMLSNLETEKDKLIQIILIGQPELRDKLKLSNMIQFKQRIAIHYHLYPLTCDETQQYITHRLHVAHDPNSEYTVEFTERAVIKIYEFSGGVPRIINNVCDNALLTAYANGTRQVDYGIACEVTGEIFESHEHEKTNEMESELLNAPTYNDPDDENNE